MIAASELAQRLNLRKSKRDWRGACPACGYSNSFSLMTGKNGQPLAWCASCQDRDSVASALHALLGDDQAGEQRLNHGVKANDEAARRAKKQEAALRLWNGSNSLIGTLGERYLKQRGLTEIMRSPTLRYRDDCYHPDGGKLPALVALVVNVDGNARAVHRTFIDRFTAKKTTRDPAKASLGPVWHNALRLQPLEPGRPLVIGEGIETAASAGLMIGAPAWAAISCGNLEHAMQLPPEATDIVIAADKDDPGERAAQSAARRWQAEGRRVRIARPNGPGDFNCQLLWDAHHG